MSSVEFLFLPKLTDKSTSQKNQILKRSILGLQNKEIIGVWNEKVWEKGLEKIKVGTPELASVSILF